MVSLSHQIVSFLNRRLPFPFLPRWGFYLPCFLAIAVLSYQIAMTNVCFALQVAADGSNPAIRRVAAAIAEMKATPAEQAALVGYATEHLIENEQGRNVYGSASSPRLNTVFAQRREHHWLYPRGDCKTMALVAGSLLSALDIKWKAVANPVTGRMWVRVQLREGSFDLLSGDALGGLPSWQKGLTTASGLLGFATPLPPPPLPNSRFILAMPAGASPADCRAYIRDFYLLGAVYLDGAATKVHQPLDFDSPTAHLAVLERGRASALMAGFPFGETR